MKQKLIIDDTPLTLDLDFMHLENLLIEVTCLEDRWHQYIASGIRFIEIEGKTEGDKIISDIFQIIDTHDDIFVLKSI